MEKVKLLTATHWIYIFMSNKAFCATTLNPNMPTADDVLKMEIARVNLHLPTVRPTLSQLLAEEKPRVHLRDGSESHFKRSELEYVESLLDDKEVKLLRLPIILEISTVYRGYFRVRGRIEVKVVEKILETYDELEEKTEGLYPRYLLPRVRRVLPTTTTYAFIAE